MRNDRGKCPDDRAAELETELDITKRALALANIGGQAAYDKMQVYETEIERLRENTLLECGHHRSLLIISAETGLPLYCDLCDARSAQRDAESGEAAYGAKLRAVETLVSKWEQEAAIGRIAADRPGIKTEVSVTMHAIVENMLQLARELVTVLKTGECQSILAREAQEAGDE